MRNKHLLNGLAAMMAVAVLYSIGLHAQLQQSGGPGSTVTVGAALPAGSNVIGHVIVDTAPSTVVTNANLDAALSTRLKPADTLTGVTTVGAVTAITNALPAGTNLLGAVNTVPRTACGSTAYDSTPAFLPTSAGAVTATATCVMGIYLTNLDSSAHTVTVTDGSTLCSSGVCTYVGPAFSIPALSNMNLPLEGMKLTGGVKWQVTDASTNKVIGQVYGFQ